MGKGPFTASLPHRQGMGLSDGVSKNSLNFFQAESGMGIRVTRSKSLQSKINQRS